MANPRQRRKARSGTSKVSNSKKSVKNKHKVIVKGPQVLVENWDRTKTVRQNYRALGLLPALNPRQAGGLEPVESTPYALDRMTEATMQDLETFDPERDGESEEEEGGDDGGEAATTTTGVKKEKALVPGLGRIERDPVTGKALRIILPGVQGGPEIVQEVKAVDRSMQDDEDDEDDQDKEEEQEEGTVTPWGEPMKDWDEDEWMGIEEEEEVELMNERKQGIPIGKGAKRKGTVEAKTDVVKTLEALAATGTKVVRHTSEFEYDWLVALVKKYDDDVDRMTRDRKANVWQKTKGEILRAVKKAGGFETLRRLAQDDE
ncbi:BQ2448_5940 [Microbotryum intermedium]|uniref:Nucleolar protein 16 n=1 Tax=Microbotryum intermedium TaxID=269621 RepID=A0A238F623_9BASI|nr:BQ2448_5940 [Microbotryum intermedium]